MDDDDDGASQRPSAVDLAALERELDEKYLGYLSLSITYLTSHADIPIDLEIILKHCLFMFFSRTSLTPSMKTKRSQPAERPPAGGWALMLDKVLIHTKSVERSLSGLFRGGDGRLGMTFTLPFV
jgi:hypothetical protein